MSWSFIGIPCKPSYSASFSPLIFPTTLSFSNLSLYLQSNKFFPRMSIPSPLRITLDPPGLDPSKMLVDCKNIGSLLVTNREGTQPYPSAENWIKDLLSMVLPTRARLSFPHSQSLPSGSLHRSHPSEGRQKNYNPTTFKTKTITTES